MKKLGAIGGVIVLLFFVLIALQSKSNDDKLEASPYDTDNLQQSTIDLINDENYQNIILPEELDAKIKSGEGVFAYMFSPTCEHCKAFTPKLMPLADEVGIHIDQLNVLEYQNAWTTYAIEHTPTLIYFKDGEEVNRLVGNAEEETVRQFFASVE